MMRWQDKEGGEAPLFFGQMRGGEMPIGRVLLKSISQSHKLAILRSDLARLLFTWLIPHLDINGNFFGDAITVNSLVFTRLGKRAEEVEEALKDLERVGLIKRYQVRGEMFLNVPSFKEKQPRLNVEREGRPIIPKKEEGELLFNDESGVGQELLVSNSGVSPAEFKFKLNLNKVKYNVKDGKDGEGSGKGVSDKKRLIREIIDYFNKIAGQRRAVTTETERLIGKLINKGYGMDDFKRVIEFKVWDFSQKEEMKKYIRPATFFAEARFEDYLEQERAWRERRGKKVGEMGRDKRRWSKEERERWRATVEREIRKNIKDEDEVQRILKEWDKNNPE